MSDERSREELIACLGIITADPSVLGSQGIAVIEQAAAMLLDDGPKVEACAVMLTCGMTVQKFDPADAGNPDPTDYLASIQRRGDDLGYMGVAPLPELAVLAAAAKLPDV